MDNVINKNEDIWVRPWEITEFNDLYNRDERFFSIVIKGLLGFLNRNIKMYNESINHYIFNTGSSYMYVESNGYDYSWNEVTGENWMYSKLPRCIVELGDINIPMEELSQSYARGNFERKTINNEIKGYNAEMKRMPIEISVTLHYVFGTFNESIVVLQELIEKMFFQKYFKVTYLGQIVMCSIEYPNNAGIQFNKPDFTSPDKNQKTIDLQITVCTYYPIINELSAIEMNNVIKGFIGYLNDDNNEQNIIIEIDGTTTSRDEIFLDISKYDFNEDGIINENEISIIKDFINVCDIDEDGMVTSNDINLITEIFIKNEYVSKFDILNIGVFDMKNLMAIKKLFTLLDLNYDNKISEEEINHILKIITAIKKIKISNQLTIGYEDFFNLINFVNTNNSLTFISLMKDFNKYLDTKIKNTYNDIYINIKNLLKQQLFEDIKYEILNNINILSKDVYNELITYINKILDFQKYDLLNDGIISNEDIDVFVNVLKNITHKNLTYHVSSAIYIHQNGNLTDNSSITDKEDYVFNE